MTISNTKQTPLVTIVILNWNRPEDTIACLESLKTQDFTDFEVLVVDNGSKDNSVELLEKIEGITLIKNPVNRGFTGGHIDGLARASGKYILVLNNDSVVKNNFISTAVQTLEADDSIAVTGGRAYSWKDGESPFDETLPFLAFQNINPVSLEGIFKHSDDEYTHEVNWISGSAMLLRKTALDASGYFHDPFFAYYEESDLFSRIQAAGYKIVYNPELRIWHKNGASSSSYFQFNQLFKNRFLYGLRNLEARELPTFIKNYAKTTLRGSYYHILKKGSNSSSVTLNKALSNALLHSILTFPKSLTSRRDIQRKDTLGLTLKKRLIIEATPLSLVITIEKKGDFSGKLLKYIHEVTFAHYPSEFIIVYPENLHETFMVFRDKITAKTKVRGVINKNLSPTHPANLGWLSATFEYIHFVAIRAPLSVQQLRAALLKSAGVKYSFYTNSIDEHSIPSPDVIVSRSLLSLYGGLRDTSITESLRQLYFFACYFKQAKSVVAQNTVNQSGLVSVIPSDTLTYIKQTIHSFNNQAKKNNRYAKIIDRYYRIYQLDNLLRWLFVKDITPRHKLARIRNSIIATIRLQRRELAVELKHMSNEVVKAKHSGFSLEERENEFSVKATQALSEDNWKQTPIFIICRDRVTPLLELLRWVDSQGLKNVFLIDNASIYPSLLEYYNQTPHQVIQTNKNIGHTVVWAEGIAKTLFPGKYYIVTDPDVIPDAKCPDDAIQYFYKLHKKYTGYQKVGFGLQIDDLPDFYKLKNTVIAWERQFWNNSLEESVYEAGVDTTFALYKPYTNYYMLHPSIRTGRPYTARHLPWYVDSTAIDEEEAFYRMHASQDITSWNTDEILERYKKELERK